MNGGAVASEAALAQCAWWSGSFDEQVADEMFDMLGAMQEGAAFNVDLMLGSMDSAPHHAAAGAHGDEGDDGADQEDTSVLHTVLESVTAQGAQLDAHASDIRGEFERGDRGEFEALLSRTRSMMTTVEREQAAVRLQLDEVRLSPYEIYAAQHLLTALHVQHTQLEIFEAEVRAMCGGTASEPLAALVVVRDECGHVICKGKQLASNDLGVRMLVGATVQVRDVSAVRCHVTGHEETTAAKLRMVDGGEQQLDSDTLTAHFPLTFLEGTRKAPIRMQFAVEADLVQLGGQSVRARLQSAASSPMMVMTNQKQWWDSERVLFRIDAFGGASAVPWARFANTLQRRLIATTYQTMDCALRPLSCFDLAYIHSNFFHSSDTIAASDLDRFWQWYGRTLQALRFQRGVCDMWTSGLVYGYMSKEDAEAALHGEPDGTFVVRFSESFPGQFTVAYARSGAVRHYLVKATDTAGAKITLADFLQQSTVTHVNQFHMVGWEPVFSRVHKQAVLEPFCSNVEAQSGEGYDETLL